MTLSSTMDGKVLWNGDWEGRGREEGVEQAKSSFNSNPIPKCNGNWFLSHLYTKSMCAIRRTPNRGNVLSIQAEKYQFYVRHNCYDMHCVCINRNFNEIEKNKV